MSNKWHQYKIIGDTLPNLQDIHLVFLLNHELVGMQEYHELWKITGAEDKPLKAKGVDTSTDDCWIQAHTKMWASLLTLSRVPVGQKQKTKKQSHPSPSYWTNWSLQMHEWGIIYSNIGERLLSGVWEWRYTTKEPHPHSWQSRSHRKAIPWTSPWMMYRWLTLEDCSLPSNPLVLI